VVLVSVLQLRIPSVFLVARVQGCLEFVVVGVVGVSKLVEDDDCEGDGLGEYVLLAVACVGCQPGGLASIV
jgi:hypothetical protein